MPAETAMSRASLRASAVVVLLPTALFGQSRDEDTAFKIRQALEERVFLQTIEEQGGRSHASGDRPELGPVSLRDVAIAGQQTLRVGITPSSFDATGTLLAEYDTAAAHNHGRVDITATGAFELVNLATGGVVVAATSADTLGFTRTGAGVAVTKNGAALVTLAGPLRARPAQNVLLIVSSIRRINRLLPPIGGQYQRTPAPYRGDLDVYASEVDATKLRLANVLGIEEYVPGVVVNESLATFHIEALRAQAITARGYALANLGRFSSRGFDIDDSTLSQMYRGQSSEVAVALEASGSTTGLVLSADGRLVSALYSSSMGGHTESNEYVFPSGGYPGTNAHPALRGIHDSASPLAVDLGSNEGVLTFYSTVYPGAYEVNPGTGLPLTSLHRWQRTRTTAELLERLRASFGVPASASSISDMTVTLRGASGRMMRVVIDGDWGATTVTGWSDLRRLATLAGVSPGGTSASSAPNSPSAFTLTRDGGGHVVSVAFVGGGFGHNVGLSQYGAHGRALRAQPAADILRAYYTGTEVGTPPLVSGGVPAPYRFTAPDGHALLVVRDLALGASLAVRLNGQVLPLVGNRWGILEADVSQLLSAAQNELDFDPLPGGVVVQVVLPALR